MVTGIGGIYHITSSTDVITGIYVLDSCRWVGATTAGHACVMTDSSGNVLFTSVANASNFIDGWAFKSKWVDGIAFSAMDSGTMDLYLT